MQTYDSGVSRSHEVIVRSADEVFQVIQALCSHVGADFVLFNSKASKLIKHWRKEKVNRITEIIWIFV